MEGAELVLEEVPPAGRCRGCGAESELDELPADLPALRRARRRAAAGRGAAGRRAGARGSAGRTEGCAMAAEPRHPGVEEVHILWISEGMSCDGDSVSITAAGQPSIEDVLLGAIPGIPKVHLHNKVLSPTLGGEEFLVPFRAAADDELDAPFVLVDRGLDPEREDQRRRLLDLVRQRPGHRRAAHDQLVDRPPGAEGVGRRRDRHLRHLRRHPRDGRQPDRLHGPRRLPGLGLPLGRRPADRQRPRLPGAAGQLHGDADLAALPGGRPRPRDPARRHSCGRRGCSARPSTRAATARATTSRATSRRTTTRRSAR